MGSAERLGRFLGKFTVACIAAMIIYYIATNMDPKSVPLLFACYAFISIVVD